MLHLKYPSLFKWTDSLLLLVKALYRGYDTPSLWNLTYLFITKVYNIPTCNFIDLSYLLHLETFSPLLDSSFETWRSPWRLHSGYLKNYMSYVLFGLLAYLYLYIFLYHRYKKSTRVVKVCPRTRSKTLESGRIIYPLQVRRLFSLIYFPLKLRSLRLTYPPPPF